MRSGGWVADQGKSLSDVMMERFGHVQGVVVPRGQEENA